MSNAKKKSFILYTDFKEVLDKLSDEQAGRVFKSLLEWQSNGSIENADTLTDLITTPIITQFKRDQNKWEEIRLKRSEAGRKGGRPRGDKAKKAIASFDKQTITKKAVNVTVNGNVNDTVRRKESDRSIVELIYKAYPKKVGKGAAIKAIEKALQTIEAEKLKEAVEAYAAAVAEWPASDKNFIKHPSTWFNQQCWEDDRETWKRQNTKINGRTNGTTNRGVNRNAGTRNEGKGHLYAGATGGNTRSLFPGVSDGGR